MTSSSSSSPGIDTTVPSTARMYDYWLGGHDNFAADRAAALAVSEAAPEAQLMAVENRGFLRRAVRHLAADAGITPFLDIGTGLPTQGNVHQVAQDINPAARVVYVDNNPMVLAHSRALKTGGNTVVIEADLRDPQSILDHPGTRKLIDFGQPLAVLLVAVLHFISDDDGPPAIVAAIRDALGPGSYLVLSHVTGDIRSDSAANAAVHYKKVTSGATLRGRDEILRFFAGLELIDPGRPHLFGAGGGDRPGRGLAGHRQRRQDGENLGRRFRPAACRPGRPHRLGAGGGDRPGDNEGGRGLMIVDALCERWGYYHPTHGSKAVWAELLIPLPTRESGHLDMPPAAVMDDPRVLHRVHAGLKNLQVRGDGSAAQQVWTQGRYTNMAETWETAVRTAANTMLRYPDKISDGLEAELYALLEQLDTTTAEQPASTGTPDNAL